MKTIFKTFKKVNLEKINKIKNKELTCKKLKELEKT